MKITSIRDLFFFVLDIAFLAVMTWLFSSTLIEKWQIEQSEKTDGCVISSRDNVRVSHRKGRRREHHSYSCTFSYEVGGHRYTAHDSISGYVTPIGFELPRNGQPITVFYDSENPQSAKVFNPEIHFFYWIGYMALFAGLWLFWPLRFQRKETCGKSRDRCVENSSGACKLWMGRYWRNANAPILPCVLMIIAGLGFTWITLDTGLAYCKSSSIVGCICLALNFASNLAIYLALSCLMSKINPIQRRHRFLAVFGAIISCIVLFILWSAFRAAWKDVFGIRGKFLLWPLLFYIEGCRGLWRWIVGVRDARMQGVGVAVPKDKLREVDDGVTASKNTNRIAICGLLIAVAALMGIGVWWWQRRQIQTNTQEFVRLCEVGKWDDAFALSQKADRKNPAFQFYLGQMYANGWGVVKDDAEAVRWYRKAANQDVAEAQYNLGVCYDKGEGVAQDAAVAVSWYRKAAYREVAEAQYNLGVCHDKGEGVEKDAAKALHWYRKAAEQGSARAQCNLGGMYIKGRGVEKDTAEAVRWYRKAAEQGNVSAQYNLGVCYDNGEGVAKDAAESVRWFRKAAEQGDADAQYNLGVCYDKGEGVEKDAAKALRWYRKAAEQGSASAQCNLGGMYIKGRGVEKDTAEAVRWYRKAAEQGNVSAQYNLGVCYDNGEGVAKDAAEAVRWYRKAADQGDKKAQEVLNENNEEQTVDSSGVDFSDLRNKLTYVAERGDENEKRLAQGGLRSLDGDMSGYSIHGLNEIWGNVNAMYDSVKTRNDDFTPEERKTRMDTRYKQAQEIGEKLQFVVDQNGDDESLAEETEKAKNGLSNLAGNRSAFDRMSDADVSELQSYVDELYSAARNRSEKWRLFSDGPKGEWCSTGQMSVSDVIAHNSKRGLLALDSFLGVRFGENFRKYVRDNKRVDLQDGIFMVKAQTNKILDFDKYSLAVLCDGRVVGVEARASIKADSVDAFVSKLLSILKTKYGRMCLQQSCDRDIWKIFFPDREHPRGMSGVDVNIVPMSSEVGVIVDRPRQGNSLAVVYLFARDVRLWNDCHKVRAQKVAEENERARQKALDAL